MSLCWHIWNFWCCLYFTDMLLCHWLYIFIFTLPMANMWPSLTFYHLWIELMIDWLIDWLFFVTFVHLRHPLHNKPIDGPSHFVLWFCCVARQPLVLVASKFTAASNAKTHNKYLNYFTLFYLKGILDNSAYISLSSICEFYPRVNLSSFCFSGIFPDSQNNSGNYNPRTSSFGCYLYWVRRVKFADKKIPSQIHIFSSAVLSNN